MRGKKRPAKERAQAVGIAVATSIAEASRQTGIPEPTIHKWYHSAEFEELRTRNKDEVVGEWWAGVQKAFRRTVDLLEQTEDPVKAATAGAIIFDKMALSSGQATSRSESRDITAQLNDHENDWVSDLVRGVIEDKARRRAETPAVEVAESPGAAPTQD